MQRQTGFRQPASHILVFEEDDNSRLTCLFFCGFKKTQSNSQALILSVNSDINE